MSQYSGTAKVTSGLVFEYDMNNTQKSWKGAPVTNYFYSQNARTDASYGSYSATSSGTWNAKHPDAIRVYNEAGSELTSYVNSGVTDWTNTYHATWVYDPELQRPVVLMQNVAGTWQAKSWSTGQSMATMGLAAGNTYTISWLQWTDNIARSANVGLYGQNTSAVWGFHDGLSNDVGSSSAFNTRPFTWQRVYSTFTVNAVRDMNAGINCYMYGHYGTTGVLKIADVQLETGSVPSAFNKTQSRSTTQALLDTTGINSITANSLAYSSNNTFSFNGTTSSLNLGNVLGNTTSISLEVWLSPSSSMLAPSTYSVVADKWSSCYLFLFGGLPRFFINGDSNNATGTTTLATNGWYHIVGTYDSSTIKVYVNGNLEGSTAYTTAISTNILPLEIMARTAGLGKGNNYISSGKVPIARVYNRALSAAEVQQNFNALRSRFGI